MVMIVGIALLATVWSNRKLRRQAGLETALDRDQRQSFVPATTDGPNQQRTHARKSSKAHHREGTWQSRPYSSFGLSYTSSEVSLGSPGSRQTVLLPPRPEVAMNLPPAVSNIGRRTDPTNGRNREEAEKGPMHRASETRTSLNQFQESPAEEAGYLPASPSILRPYLREDGIGRTYQTQNPYDSFVGAGQHMPGSYPPTQRSSYQTTYQHQSLSPNSRYSHMLPNFLESYHAAGARSDAQEPERGMSTEDTAHHAMLPRTTRVRFDQDHRRYHPPPLDLADMRADARNRGYRSGSLSHQGISPIDTEGSCYTQPEPLSPSEPFVSPLEEDTPHRDLSMEPLPLSPTRIARTRASSGAGMHLGGLSEPRPEALSSRDPNVTNTMVGSGRRPHLAFLTQGAFGPRSVASTAQSQTHRETRKLQKRRPSDGQAKSMTWSS